MGRKFLTCSLLLLILGVAPLTVVAFLDLRAGDYGDAGYFLWAVLSAACAALTAFAFRALAAGLLGPEPPENPARVARLSYFIFVLTFLLMLPLWPTVLDPFSESVWARLAFYLFFLVATMAAICFLALPSYRMLPRRQFRQVGREFDGSDIDKLLRPSTYVDDIKWLVALIVRRLTSAST